MAKNFYELLGVPRNASEKEVRQAYRRLARKHHPDVNRGDPKAETRFKEINEAYQVLSSPESRKRYDTYGVQRRHADLSQRQGTGDPFTWGFRGPVSPRSRPSSGLGEDPGNFGGLGDLFGDLFGSRREHRATVEELFRREPLEVPVTITLEEAYGGTTRLLQVPADPVTGAPPRRLQVTVPPGVDSGSRVHINAPSPQRQIGMELYLAITVAPHARFERKGDYLCTTVEVPLAKSVTGGEVEVAMLQGKRVALKLPPETQNGRTFRLKNKGMPRRNAAGQYGDLLATIKVTMPTHLSEEERELFRRLQQLRPE